MAGWSNKDELDELVDELSLDTEVEGQGDWARLTGGKEIGMEVKNVLEKNMIPELYGMGIRDAIYLLENSLVHFASYIFYTDVDDQLFDSHITQVSNEYSIL